MGIILVYDATDEASFNNIRRWAAQINTHGAEGTDRLLVGNKADCDPQQRKVDAAQGQALADEYGIPFLETSARSGQNVKEAFTQLADAVRVRLQGKSGQGPPTKAGGPPGSVQLRPGADPEGGARCCGG